jgi:hypothetical protein
MSAPNLSSLLRSKNPLSHLPEFTALKSDVGALQRRAGECEACERRVDALERQRHADAVAMERKMRALGDAFRVLSDVVVSELESLRADVRAQRHDLDVTRAQMRWTHGAEASVRELRAFVHENVVREGARRERRDAELSRRVETAEIENARRESDADAAADADEASAAYRKACDARLAMLERRAAATENAVTRYLSREAAAHTEALAAETWRSDADRAARFPASLGKALGGGGGGGGGETRLVERRSSGRDEPVSGGAHPERARLCDANASLAGLAGFAGGTYGHETISMRSGTGSATAASLMSPAAERFMRDDVFDD